MSVTPPSGSNTPPPPVQTETAQQQARRGTGDGAMGAGGNRAGQQGAGQKGPDTARQSRFDGALAKARGPVDAETSPLGLNLPGTAGQQGLGGDGFLGGDQDGPEQQRARDGQTAVQVLHVVAPQATAQTGPATPAAQGAQAHAADIQHLSDRIGTEVRLAESQALRGAPGSLHSLTLNLGRNGLGLSGVTLMFGAKDVTVTLRLPAGGEAHGFNEATAQLAQALAQRFPTRTIRIARDDGTEINTAQDTTDAPTDPFSLLRRL
jgi:hypothetical protein